MLSMLLALAATYALPPTYTASARVTLQPNASRFFTVRVGDGGVLSSTEPVKTVTETYSQLLRSRPLAERVVDELHLDRPRQLSFLRRVRGEVRRALNVAVAIVKYGEYHERAPHDAAVAGIQQSLDPRRFKESYVLEIRARADSPEFAALIANTASRLSESVLNELAAREARKRKEASTQLVTEIGKDLVAANEELEAFRKANSSSGADALNTRIIGRLAEVEGELQRVSAALADQQLRLAGVSNNANNVAGAASSVQEGTRALDSLKASLLATRAGLTAELNLTPAKRSELSGLLARQAAASIARDKALTEKQDATIAETRGDPSVQSLEEAQKPLYPSGAPRGVVVAVAMLASLLLWMVAVLTWEGIRRARAKPGESPALAVAQ
jgi:uncharacterized protein involved in exopolysaccharide biosynthesis